MLKLLTSLLCCVTLSHAANSFPSRIDDLVSPCVIAERPGIYKVTLSTDIVVRVLDGLRSLPKDGVESQQNAPAEKFHELLRSFIYPHPSTINGVKTLWKSFGPAILDIREILGVGESLPYFLLSEYEKSGSLDEAIGLFKGHIEDSLRVLPAQPDPELVRDILSQKLPSIKGQAQELLNKYRAFYDSRTPPFRKHDIEEYVLKLLEANSDRPIGAEKLAILDILQRAGFLTLATPITESKFTYSPNAMVASFIEQNRTPENIVLGCGHADSRDMLEALRLKAETWCGACDKLPHAGAMVVSLDESSADILCDLNHPDLWSSLRDRSVKTIYDETKFLSCYLPTTLDQIARVLRVGGEFHSNDYGDGLPIKAYMIARGFEVVKEDIADRVIILRKVR